jgi:hypothetical protein
VSDAFSAGNASEPAKWHRAERRLRQELGVRLRHLPQRDRFEPFAVIRPQCAERGVAEAGSFVEDGIENCGEIAGRAVDDMQHLSGRSLLLQGLPRFGEEPRIFHRDHRLRSEIFEQRDLLVRKRAAFSTIGKNGS